MKKSNIIIIAISLLAAVVGIYYFSNKDANESDQTTETDSGVVSDSLREARSDEIKAALRDGGNQLSPLDYAFIASEIQQVRVEDTLAFAFTPFQHSIQNQFALNGVLLSPDLATHQFENPDSKYVYLTWSEVAAGESHSQYISDVVGMERVNALLWDSTVVDHVTQPLIALFETADRVAFTDIPEEYFTYEFTSLEDDIKNHAFSEVVGEDEIMDFLIKDLENTLKIIESDTLLTISFNYWLDGLDTPDGWMYYSDDYPAEIHARKLDYLIAQLKKSTHPFAKKTWQELDKVEIVKID